LRDDGTLIARAPMTDGPRRLDPTQHPFTEFAKGPTGQYRAVSVVDGIERLVAFRRLPDLGLTVTAGQPVDALLRDWRNRTQNATALLAVALLLVLGLSLVIDETLRRQSQLLLSLRQKADELADALGDKDVLFQELHHRVKNNLQVISSLLTMQSLRIEDKVAQATLKDALDRIHSMGLVHQTLYQRNEAASVDLADYFSQLTGALAGNHAGPLGSVAVEMAIEGTLDLDRAMPLGMLANEALVNAFKHAFPNDRPGTLTVSLQCGAESWRLVIEDDGVGLALKPGQGIGLGLIRALARQLGGKAEIGPRDGGGTVVSVRFPA
jgi:two-component sensor histidine kinase